MTWFFLNIDLSIVASDSLAVYGPNISIIYPSEHVITKGYKLILGILSFFNDLS